MDKTCVKCNGVLKKCKLGGTLHNLRVTKLPEKHFFSDKESSYLSTYVCSSCGYMEWYANNPERLK